MTVYCIPGYYLLSRLGRKTLESTWNIRNKQRTCIRYRCPYIHKTGVTSITFVYKFGTLKKLFYNIKIPIIKLDYKNELVLYHRVYLIIYVHVHSCILFIKEKSVNQTSLCKDLEI